MLANRRASPRALAGSVSEFTMFRHSFTSLATSCFDVVSWTATAFGKSLAIIFNGIPALRENCERKRLNIGSKAADPAEQDWNMLAIESTYSSDDLPLEIARDLNRPA